MIKKLSLLRLKAKKKKKKKERKRLKRVLRPCKTRKPDIALVLSTDSL